LAASQTTSAIGLHHATSAIAQTGMLIQGAGASRSARLRTRLATDAPLLEKTITKPDSTKKTWTSTHPNHKTDHHG
jgi:hypothetical protein